MPALHVACSDSGKPAEHERRQHHELPVDHAAEHDVAAECFEVVDVVSPLKTQFERVASVLRRRGKNISVLTAYLQ